MLYLATDRNDIPIKMEYYAGPLDRRRYPAGISRCDDFREIAPGIWYPFRVTGLGLDSWSLIVQGWVLLDWRRDTTFESITAAPRIRDAVFHDVVVPAGTNVSVWDEAGRPSARSRRPRTGSPRSS